MADYLAAALKAGTAPALKPVSIRVLPSGIGFFHGDETVGQVFETRPPSSPFAMVAEGHVIQDGARVASCVCDGVDYAVEAVRYALEQYGYGPFDFVT